MSEENKERISALVSVINSLNTQVINLQNQITALTPKKTTIVGTTIVGGDDWSDYKDIKMDLTFPEPKAVSIDPKKTLLQIVDMQTDFVGPTVRGTKYKPEYIANIQNILEIARRLNISVVHQYYTPFLTPYEKTKRAISTNLQDPTYGPIIDEVKPKNRPEENIVQHRGPDIFFHTWMKDLLNKLRQTSDIDTVILVGTPTHDCVMYAVAYYCCRGYRVIVPMDGVIDLSKESQAMTLQIIPGKSPNFPATITLSKMITFNETKIVN